MSRPMEPGVRKKQASRKDKYAGSAYSSHTLNHSAGQHQMMPAGTFCFQSEPFVSGQHEESCASRLSVRKGTV